MAVSLCGQIATVDLAVSPDGAPRQSGRKLVQVVAQVAAQSTPLSVTLRLTDSAGTTLRTLGSMHDDGLDGDTAALDGKYTMQLNLPIDKIGVYYFRAHVEMAPPLPSLDSKVAPFWVQTTTEINSDNDLDGTNDGNMNAVIVAITQSGIRSLRVYRSDSVNGPWTEIFPAGNQPSNFDDDETPVPKFFDPDETATTQDRYYKVEAYDASGSIKKTYSPVYIPAYTEQDRLLRLAGDPFESEIAAAKRPAASEKKPRSGTFHLAATIRKTTWRAVPRRVI